jgi:DNA-binding transcriptional regulator GbsR (MarR family)
LKRLPNQNVSPIDLPFAFVRMEGGRAVSLGNNFSLTAPITSDISVKTENNDMETLTETARKFILHWGEMGTRWGINRTVAQIHALLYLSDRPLHAEEICQTLVLARSNVSVALRELQNWGIVKVTHLPGDRRDHFESMSDVFEMFRVIMNERRKREIDPTLKLIDDCLDTDAGDPGEALVRARLEKMRDFFELALTFSSQLDRVSTPSLVKAARMGDKALRLLGLAGKPTTTKSKTPP